MATVVQAKIGTFLREYKQTEISRTRQQQQELDDGLVQAAFSGDLNLVQWYLAKGASCEYWQDAQFEDPNIEEHLFRSSALLVACQRGHIDVVINLYKNIINESIQQRLREGLHNYWAILVETLKNRNLIHGRNTVVDDNGREINVDFDPFLRPYNFLDNIPLLKYLIDCGADVNVKGRGSKTLLMKAATSPHYADALRILLEAGADPDIKYRQYYSALVCAARSKNADAMRTLLEFGASLEYPTTELFVSDFSSNPSARMVNHALVWCVALGHIREAQVLVQWGARPSMIPHYLLYVINIIDFSHLNQSTDCISFLQLAFYRVQPEIVRYFLEINFFSQHDITALSQDEDLLSWQLTAADLEREREAAKSHQTNSSDDNVQERKENGVEHAVPPADPTKYPANETLRLLREFSSQPRSLFSLSIVCVRQTFGTDIFSIKDVAHLESSLHLPRPLIKSILYSNSCI
ncbi:ankyrin repeat protein [Plakobranchus ocellatus]|uniref:Ankyrin repeat protein n=1 Tax=Plakobranchus ocellatus TaxID=259542 RepID=A0AAV3Z4T4_9GAST|nr:ankyrin repeat protein [Plakobranchus ocellatus]